MVEEQQHEPVGAEAQASTATAEVERDPIGAALDRGNAEHTEADATNRRDASPERQRIDALTGDERASIMEAAARYSWDHLDAGEVDQLRVEVDSAARAVEKKLTDSGLPVETEIVQGFITHTRNVQTAAVLERAAPAPAAVAESDEQQQPTEEQTVALARRNALQALLATGEDEYDTLRDQWQIYEQMKVIAQREAEEAEAQAEDAARDDEKKRTMDELNGKHEGLMARVNGLPVEWDKVKAVIESKDPSESYAARWNEFSGSDAYTQEVDENEGYVRDRSQAERLAVVVFTNTYVTERLMPLLPALEEGGPPRDLQAIRKDFCTLAEDPTARADMDTYSLQLHPSEQNYASPAASTPEVTEAPAAPAESGGSNGTVEASTVEGATKSKKDRFGAIGRFVRTGSFRKQ